MKRRLTCALALIMLTIFSVPAFADSIWEPSDNMFYDLHRNKCQYENRRYYANGKNGYVTLVSAPGSSMVRSQYKNGEVLRAAYTYGSDWALIECLENQNDFSGWVRMSDLALVYDYQCFEEEYGDRIRPYNNEFADYDGDAAVFRFYEYPGAPEIKQSCAVQNKWRLDIVGSLTGTSGSCGYIQSIFVDEDGRTWGFIDYMYVCRDVWFCLDAPDGENFPVREVPAVELTPAREPVLPVTGYLPYILVAAVVGATAGVLVYFYGKKKKSTD